MSRKIKMRESMADIPIAVCLIFIVGGLLLGNVMVIGTWHWGALIDASEAREVSATLDHYEKVYAGKGLSSPLLNVYFSDHEMLRINAACYKTEVERRLDTLQRGDVVQMLIHPHADEIWELKKDGFTVLAFEDSRDSTKIENIGFTILGAFMYSLVVLGTISLIFRYARHRKRNKVSDASGRKE